MISSFRKNSENGQILSKETKDKILKHKRRMEYFFLFLPSMLILLGYFINSIETEDYTNFKLAHVFLMDFINKITFNIFPIIIITLILIAIIFITYKPKIAKVFFITALLIALLSSFINVEAYIYEFMYQVNILYDKMYALYNREKFLVIAFIISFIVLLFAIKQTGKLIIRCLKGGTELFLISSIVYLEYIGEYSPLFFVNNFINLFIKGLRLLSQSGELLVLIFVSTVFLSLYNNKLRAIIFFMKNKIKIAKQTKLVKNNPDKYSNLEVIQITDKIQMSLLTHKHLPAIAAIIPAFNEDAIVPSTIDSLLNVDYNKNALSIIVVSDGSTDNTVHTLINKYDMYRTTVYQNTGLAKVTTVRSVYRSRQHKNLILIDKDNGGKADALNLGIQYLPSNIKYVSVIDADSVVDKYAFRIFATAAQEDERIVALTGTILPRQTEKSSGFKSTLLTNTQLFDYLSSFHGERGALSLLNSILIIPGAFGFFDKQALLNLDGYPRGVLAEDGILTVNLHRKKDAIIKFIPEALSYTQVPSSFGDLRKQRMRWFKGLTELLVLFKNTWKDNIKLSLVFLEYLLVEWLTPIMIPMGICAIIANPAMVTHSIFQFFMALSIITPIIKGILCMSMESSYRKVSWSKLIYLPLSVLLSPLIVLWRNDALLDLGNKNWGFLKRY